MRIERMTDEKMTITSAVDAYISHLMLSRKPRTAEQAMFVLHPFKRIFGDRLLSGFTRHDHDGYILNLPQGARTKTNHSVRICALLRHFDFPEGELKRMAKARPKFIKKPPVSYTQAEIEKFMAAARDHSFKAYAYFLFLWKSGVRDQEAAHATIDDVRDGVLYITAKNGFTPKNSEEREIPLPDDVRRLIAQLDRKPGQLLFPSRNGTVSQTWLRTAKRIAVRAGLDPAKVCLHKWRKTYVTRLLDKGVAPKTVMDLAGHASLNTTLLYASKSRTDQKKAAVLQAFAQ